MTRIAFASCPAYADATAAVRRALDLLGGPGRFLRPGLRVLLKPNGLSDAAPDQAVTTHPEIARAVLRLVREAGAVPCVADSPAGALRREAVWEKTGFRALCEEERAPLLNLEQAGSVPFSFRGVPFTVAKPVLEADLVINLPKVKTHTLTLFTGAVKNLYGTLPGFQKATLHKTFATADEMGAFLAHLCGIVKPGLTVADGVVGMEGNGPAGGEPVKLGFVAAAEDPVALDAALCRVLNVPLKGVPWFRYLPRERLEDLELAGDAPAPGSLPFKLPSNWKSRLLPRPLIRLLAPLFWIRPFFDEARCIRCGRCAQACPAHALAFEKGRLPVLAGARCIGCCCCHESCPVKAIRMEESPLMRRISRGRLVSP